MVKYIPGKVGLEMQIHLYDVYAHFDPHQVEFFSIFLQQGRILILAFWTYSRHFQVQPLPNEFLFLV